MNYFYKETNYLQNYNNWRNQSNPSNSHHFIYHLFVTLLMITHKKVLDKINLFKETEESRVYMIIKKELKLKK